MKEPIEPTEAYLDIQAVEALPAKVWALVNETQESLNMPSALVTHEDMEIIAEAISEAFYKVLVRAREEVAEYEEQQAAYYKADVMDTWRGSR